MALFCAVTLHFWVPPLLLKIDVKSFLSQFFGFKAILVHEGGTKKFRSLQGWLSGQLFFTQTNGYRGTFGLLGLMSTQIFVLQRYLQTFGLDGQISTQTFGLLDASL